MSSHSHSSKHHHNDERIGKDVLKSLETPEQKRLRRFAKKEAKERKRKEQMGWDEEYMGYTNTDNPFGDTNLLKTFVWEKKMEKEGLKILDKEEIERRGRLKLEENKLELEKVKQRRLEREREREIRDDELTRIQREKEAAQFKEWEKQEDMFHLKQAKLRSKIRIQDGRAKPIDLLARYVSSEDEDFTVEMHEPYVYLNGLKLQDLEDLQEDINIYMELENGKNLDYWKDLQIIVEDEIHKLRKVDGTERRESINSAVGTEIVKIFKGKTPKQLQAMYNQIEKKISSGEEGIDIGYWETLLSRLKAYMARARLRERHQENLRQKLFQLKQEQGVERQPLFPCVAAEVMMSQSDDTSIPSSSKSKSRSSKTSEKSRSAFEKPSSTKSRRSSDISSDSESRLISGTEAVASSSKQSSSDRHRSSEAATSSCSSSPKPQCSSSEMPSEPSKSSSSVDVSTVEASTSDQREGSPDLPEECSDNSNTKTENTKKNEEDYLSGRYSPILINFNRLEPGVIVIDPTEDAERIDFMQQRLKGKPDARKDAISAEDKVFDNIARKGMDSDEATFSVEFSLDRTYLWSDKYRPRKPRYFNRVHTGFEWNKYNQTHYDMDNPPPKIVQGYKFNIFYPDLIDVSQTPEYTLNPCEDNKDFAILRFHSGPPYEDIAFKIVNREWEYSYKRGFRCMFHNNIFQLWFHFKRYRYRR